MKISQTATYCQWIRGANDVDCGSQVYKELIVAKAMKTDKLVLLLSIR